MLSQKKMLQVEVEYIYDNGQASHVVVIKDVLETVSSLVKSSFKDLCKELCISIPIPLCSKYMLHHFCVLFGADRQYGAHVHNGRRVRIRPAGDLMVHLKGPP